MDTRLSVVPPAELETPVLAVLVLDQSPGGKPQPLLATRDRALEAAGRELLRSGEMTGRLFETVMMHRPAGLKAERLLLVGGGKARNFSAVELRKVAGTAVRFLKPKSIREFAFLVPEANGNDVWRGLDSAAAVRAIVEGGYVADFDSDVYKSDRTDQRLRELTVVASQANNKEMLQSAVDWARILGESQNFTRTLVNEPGNRMTPTILAQRASEMVAGLNKEGLTIEIYGPEKIRELKMGAFWGVAQGSDEPPTLIVLRYEPKGAPEKPFVGLIGKGITFDSGGISIKPSDGMEKMKYDMAGGAAVLGAMRAIALLGPKVRCLGMVCASENMPSGRAQRPGDIQISMAGKSIEVINTDAEGRMVLADGLHYARQLGATHLVDAATLTGACVVALGAVNAGVFANDEGIYRRFSRALERAGEKMWRLPLDEEYREQIRSSIADIMNTGGRGAGAVTAAMFLKEFVDQTPWIHLDIAGTAWMDDNKAWIAKGPSGIAVRSLAEFVRSFADSSEA